MNSLMLLGFVTSSTADVVAAPEHVQIPIRNWTALALPIKAESQADQSSIVGWATAQNAILSEYIRSQDVVPVALGSVFSSQEALIAHAMTHWFDLNQMATRLAGSCEYNLYVETVTNVEAVVHDPTPQDGRAFLLLRQSKRNNRSLRTEHRRSFVRDLTDVLQRRTRCVLPIERTRPGRLADLAVLISRASTSDVFEALEHQASRANELGLTCRVIGPSPAFTFLEPAVGHV